jgi:hypothetical protein
VIAAGPKRNSPYPADLARQQFDLLTPYGDFHRMLGDVITPAFAEDRQAGRQHHGNTELPEQDFTAQKETTRPFPSPLPLSGLLGLLPLVSYGSQDEGAAFPVGLDPGVTSSPQFYLQDIGPPARRGAEPYLEVSRAYRAEARHPWRRRRRRVHVGRSSPAAHPRVGGPHP